MNFKSDIDIDLANRDEIIKLLNIIPASIIKEDNISKHNTGVYLTDIPVNPFTNSAAIDYKQAEDRGYFKIDLLNVNLYKQVKNEEHLISLMQEPDWNKLYNKDICEQLIHINHHYDTLIKMPEPVNSIARLAMFLAIIRPAKRHLIGKSWREVSETIWDKPLDDSYYYKKSHAISYANLVVVNLNLLDEQV